MSSKLKVQECVRRAKSTMVPSDKLDAVADAIAELAEMVELMDHQVKHMESRVRRMGL
jgi:CII-binding regulator of phage lambda lysogenization HflD